MEDLLSMDIFNNDVFKTVGDNTIKNYENLLNDEEVLEKIIKTGNFVKVKKKKLIEVLDDLGDYNLLKFMKDYFFLGRNVYRLERNMDKLGTYIYYILIILCLILVYY